MDGLGVRAQVDGLVGGDGGVLEDGLDVTRPLGVVDETGRLPHVLSGQHAEDPLVEPGPLGGRQRLLHRLPGQLVAEPHVARVAAQDARLLGLVARDVGVWHQRRQQPALGPRGDDGGVPEQAAGRGAQRVDPAERRRRSPWAERVARRRPGPR